jgi:hypothetical protein
MNLIFAKLQAGTAEKGLVMTTVINLMQLYQISQTENSSSRLADQGSVLEGVADEPFFFTPSLRSLCFCSCKINRYE